MMRRMTVPGPPDSPWSRALPAGLVGLSALALAPVLVAPSHWDDLPRQLSDAGADWVERVPALVVAPPGPGWPAGPLVTLSHALDHASGGAPALAHLHSLGWHLLGGALLLAWLRRQGPLIPALAGGALFLLHPVQVEAIGWISARGGPMGVALLLAGLLCLDRETRSPLAMGGGVLLLGLAALASPVAWLAAPALVGLALARTGRPGSLATLAAALLGPSLALGLRWLALGSLGPAAPGELGQAVPALPWLVARLSWPVGLEPGLRLESLPAHAPWVATGALLAGAGLVLGLGRAAGAVGLALAAMALGLTLTGVQASGLVSDGGLGAVLLGLALALAAALRALPSPVAGGLAALLVLLGLGGSVHQATRWMSLPALEEAAAARWPSTWLHSRIGEERERAGQLDAARDWYRRALVPGPPDALACERLPPLGVVQGLPPQVLADGQAVLDAGCPDGVAVQAPMTWAHAAEGRWTLAEARAWERGEDPSGLARTVRLAAAARRGALGPLRVAATEATQAGHALPHAAVLDLLLRAGEVQAVAAVQADLAAGVDATGLVAPVQVAAPAAVEPASDSGAP